jgi:hypothetical protein
MRANVISGLGDASPWEAGPRSAAELKEAATHWDRSAALHVRSVGAENLKSTLLADLAEWCRSQAAAM